MRLKRASEFTVPWHALTSSVTSIPSNELCIHHKPFTLKGLHPLMGGPCRELNPWSLPPLTPDSIRRGTLSTGPHTLCLCACACVCAMKGGCKAGVNLLIVPSWSASFHYRVSDPTSCYWKQTHAWLWWLLRSNPWLWQRCAEAQTQGCRFVCPTHVTHNTHSDGRMQASVKPPLCHVSSFWRQGKEKKKKLLDFALVWRRARQTENKRTQGKTASLSATRSF